MKTAFIILLTLVVIGGGVYAYRSSPPTASLRVDRSGGVCTMDVKPCPDGSYVGRTGPNCEFGLCPAEKQSPILPPSISTSSAQAPAATSTASTTQASTASSTQSIATTTASTTEALPEKFTVAYTSSGFAPKTVIIAKGGTVTFVNRSKEDLRVASDPHPIHNDYPGFDSIILIPEDSSWSFTFDRPGSWGYHNHADPTVKGTVVVQ